MLKSENHLLLIIHNKIKKSKNNKNPKSIICQKVKIQKSKNINI